MNRKTKLSELRRLGRELKPTEGRAAMIRSIQQSMRVEGFDVIAAAVDRVFGNKYSR